MTDKTSGGVFVQLHAKAVADAVFSSLINAQLNPDREDYWRAHADKLERKFITLHGHHPAHFLFNGQRGPYSKITSTEEPAHA